MKPVKAVFEMRDGWLWGRSQGKDWRRVATAFKVTSIYCDKNRHLFEVEIEASDPAVAFRLPARSFFCQQIVRVEQYFAFHGLACYRVDLLVNYLRNNLPCVEPTVVQGLRYIDDEAANQWFKREILKRRPRRAA
jgi:hypothetical protein